jgi:hypothetical protein
VTKRGVDTSRASRGPHTLGERWSWTQFVCAFVLFGLIAFLHVAPPLEGFWIHVFKTLAVAGVCGVMPEDSATRPGTGSSSSSGGGDDSVPPPSNKGLKQTRLSLRSTRAA